MRKVSAGLFISLDGVAESPDKWQFAFDDEMGADIAAQTSVADTMLLGRVTYNEWADYWPTSKDEPFASFINNIRKYVVSTTLDKAEWNNTTIIKSNLAEEVTKLKQQDGKTINVAGSISLVRSLFALGLLDELHLMIHPVVVGKGKRLFIEGMDLQRLSLVDSKTSPSGNLIVTYVPTANE
jgi:dihydrofolate reductase